MVKLRCKSFAERMFIPAFIFFFQMLYPFAWVNDPRRATAAAAGGCMLVRREALQAAGGMAAIRGALIDDCALAKLLKAQGPIGSRSPSACAACALIRRSRHPQHGVAHRLCAASLFAAAAGRHGSRSGADISRAGRACAVCRRLCAIRRDLRLGFDGARVPADLAVLRHVGLASWLWAAALPAIAAIYMAFTIDSAYQHARGRGGMWKGRAQANVSELR